MSAEFGQEHKSTGPDETDFTGGRLTRRQVLPGSVPGF